MERLKNLTLLSISVVVSLAILEGVVHLISGSIPTAVMAEAPEMAARTEFLESRGLSVGAPVMVLESSKGGRDITLLQHTTSVPVDPEDAEVGAVPTRFRVEGYCNAQPPLDIPARLVGVGDSFTYCTNVEAEDSWVHRLSGRLDVRTVNLGTPGTGLGQYYETLRAKAPATMRVAVVAIYEGNDLRDALRFRAARQRQGQDAGKERLHEQVSRLVRTGVLGDSYLMAFVWGTVRTLKDRIADPEFSYDVEVDGRRVTLNVHDADGNEVTHARMLASGKVTRSMLLEMWDEPIGWILDLAAERDFATLFVYIPSAYTAYDDSVRFHDEENGAAVRHMSRVQREVFAELCRRRSLDCIDTVSAFQENGGKRLTHFPANVHLTPYGHEIVANSVAEYIERSPELLRSLAGS